MKAITEAVARAFVFGLQSRESKLPAKEQLQAIREFQKKISSSADKDAMDYLFRQIEALESFIKR